MSAPELAAELVEWPVEPAVADSWRAFAVERENPFISPEWLGACVEELGESARVVVCRDDGGEVRGVVGLVEGSRGRARSLRFPGGGAGDLFEPACALEDEDAVGAATAAALDADRGWDVLELSRLLDGGAFLDSLAAAWPGRRPRPLRAARGEVYPYLEFGEGGIEAWLSGRSERVRKDFGKRVRKLERAGTTVRTTGGGEALERDFAVLEGLHDARWGSESEAMGEALSRLHRAFAAATLRTGWLRLTVMELEGEAVAAMYAWRLGGRYMQYIGGHDPAHRRLGVGTALLSLTIRAAAEEGAAVYDLMRGDEEYKRRVETGRRTSSSYLIARPGSARGRAATLGQRAKELGRRLPAGPRAAARSFYRRLRG